MGNYDSLLTVVKKRKCRRFGHIVKAKGTLANTILHGKLEGERKRGRPARQRLGDIKRGRPARQRLGDIKADQQGSGLVKADQQGSGLVTSREADQQGSGLVTSRETSKAAAW